MSPQAKVENWSYSDETIRIFDASGSRLEKAWLLRIDETVVMQRIYPNRTSARLASNGGDLADDALSPYYGVLLFLEGIITEAALRDSSQTEMTIELVASIGGQDRPLKIVASKGENA